MKKRRENKKSEKKNNYGRVERTWRDLAARLVIWPYPIFPRI